MRNFVTFAGIFLTLSACAQHSALPSDVVLERTLQTARSMQSVRFSLAGDVTSLLSVSHLKADGWMQSQGQQFQVNFALNEGGQAQSAIEGEMTIAGTDEHFLKLTKMGAQENAFLNQWWKLPASQSSLAAQSPDPQLLNLQLAAIRVTQDHGMSEYRGKLSYHYDTEIDQERLLAYLAQVADTQKQSFDKASWEAMLESLKMHGSVWIDAERFEVQRIEWVIDSSAQPFKLKLAIDFSDVNAAPVVSLPASAQDLPGGVSLPGTQATPLSQSDFIRSLLGTP